MTVDSQRRVMVRYRVKPELVERNEELVRAVYEQLHSEDPAGIRYATFKLDDGVTFIHIAETDGESNPLTELAAFQAFLKDIAERCDERPQVSDMQEVGSFGLFAAER